MLINAQESTLLIIDIQERLFPAIENHTDLAEHSAWLIQVARRIGVPVLLTEQYSKGLGPTIAALREGLGDELGASGWRIVEDHQIARGGCKLDTPHNQIDAQAASRWHRISHALGKNTDWLG